MPCTSPRHACRFLGPGKDLPLLIETFEKSRVLYNYGSAAIAGHAIPPIHFVDDEYFNNR